MENILNSVKLFLGIPEDYTHYDKQILMHINSVFTILSQIGVGPEDGFKADTDSLWYEYLEGDELELVKSYVYLKVRLLFDPPSISFVTDSINKQISEYEWRLNVMVDTKPCEVTGYE